MLLQLSVIVVVEALDGGLLDDPVHPLDLSVGPRMFDLGKPMFNAVLEANPANEVIKRVSITRLVRELDTVVGQHLMKVYGTALIRLRRNCAACILPALACSSVKANFEMRSMATKRYSFPSAVCTSAMSTWKYPMGGSAS